MSPRAGGTLGPATSQAAPGWGWGSRLRATVGGWVLSPFPPFSQSSCRQGAQSTCWGRPSPTPCRPEARALLAAQSWALPHPLHSWHSAAQGSLQQAALTFPRGTSLACPPARVVQRQLPGAAQLLGGQFCTCSVSSRAKPRAGGHGHCTGKGAAGARARVLSYPLALLSVPCTLLLGSSSFLPPTCRPLAFTTAPPQKPDSGLKRPTGAQAGA